MSRRALGVSLLVFVAVLLAALALKGPRGVLGWFGVSDGSESAKAPSELELDGANAGMDGGPSGGPGKELDVDRAGTLASRRIERRGVGGLALKIIRSGSGAPVEGAAVLVTGTGHGGEEVRATAVSDAQGAVKFERLAAGQGYVVRITAKSDPFLERPDIEIRAGRDKDLGAIEIGATAALTGRVVDEAGKPVAGAEVRILTGFENVLEMMSNMAEMFGTLGREPTPLAKGTTADDGRFRLDGLPPGALVIVASASGKRQTVLPVRMTAKGLASGEPTLVLETGSVIAGVVVDGLGAPIVGARLALLETGDNDPTSFMTKRTFTTTGAEGRFRALIDESSRDVRAVVEAAGFPTTFSASLKPGQEDARIVLIGGASVEVRCEDDAHAPVEGAQVALMVARGDMNAPDGVGGFLYGSTDATGLVTFTSGPGKIEMVIVNHRDFASVMGSPGRDRGGMPGKLDGDVPKEVAATGVTKALVTMHRGLVIRGKILDASGNPIAGAEVRTIGGMGFGGGAANRSAADGTYSVSGGVAATEGGGGQVGVSGTMLIVKAAGWIQKSASMSVDLSKAKAGEVLHDVTMLAGAVIRGKVLDADGSPLVGAEVRVLAGGGFDPISMMGGGGARNLTGADGSYEIRDVAPSDAGGDSPFMARPVTTRPDGTTAEPEKPSTRVLVSADDRVTAKSEPFFVAAGATVEAPAVRLLAGATLHGKVREPSGRPAIGASVEVSLDRSTEDFTFDTMSGRRGKRVVKTDAEGAFEVRALAKAKGSALARGAGFAPASVSFEVGDGDPAPIELRLAEAGELKGRIATPNGEPVAGASVRVERAPGSDAYLEPATASTDKDGVFLFKGLPRTTVQVSVTAKGYRTRTASGSVNGEAVDVRLDARNPNDERRREEIQKELQEIYAKFGTVKGDAERNDLVQRMQALQQEQRDMDSDASPSTRVDPK